MVSIVDDDAAVCRSVASLVESMGIRSTAYFSAEEFLRSRQDVPEGCLVADVRLRGMSGLELLEEVGRRQLIDGVIILTGFGDVPTAVKAMRLGAITVLQKPCRDQELWEAISKALALHVHRREEKAHLRQLQDRMDLLSTGERQVLDSIVAGEMNKAIATRLGIGLRTVESRRHTIMRKLRVQSIAELVRLVCELRNVESRPGGGSMPFCYYNSGDKVQTDAVTPGSSVVSFS